MLLEGRFLLEYRVAALRPIDYVDVTTDLRDEVWTFEPGVQHSTDIRELAERNT